MKTKHLSTRSTVRTVMYALCVVSMPILFAGCGNSESSSDQEDVATDTTKAPESEYTLTMERHEDRIEDCDKVECTHIEVTIPRLEGPDDEVITRINNAVDAKFRELVKSRLPEPIGNASWDLMTQKFIEGYELFLMEFPDFEQSWYLMVDGSGSQVRNDVFVLHISDDEYMGGAHPNGYEMFQSFDLETGHRIDVTERLNTERLRTVAEREFREVRGLAPDASLNDQGLMFPDGEFVLPENIAILGDTVWMIYNPYEVAAYSEGSTELHIPLDEVMSGAEDLP